MAPKIGYFQIAQIYPLRCQRCQIKRNKCEGTHHAKGWQYADGSASWFGNSTSPPFVHHNFARIVPWGIFYRNEAVALKTCSWCVFPPFHASFCTILHPVLHLGACVAGWRLSLWGGGSRHLRLAAACWEAKPTNQPTSLSPTETSREAWEAGRGWPDSVSQLSGGAGGSRVFLGWVGSEVDRIWSNVQRVTIPVWACSQVKRRILAGHQRPWACAAQHDYCAVKWQCIKEQQKEPSAENVQQHFPRFPEMLLKM